MSAENCPTTSAAPPASLPDPSALDTPEYVLTGAQDEPEAPLYVHHAGTVQVGGQSDPNSVAHYVVSRFNKGEPKVELLFIGANAGHQAFKAVKIAHNLLSRRYGVHIAVTPHQVKTQTQKRDLLRRPVLENGAPVYEVKDAFLWRVVDATAVAR